MTATRSVKVGAAVAAFGVIVTHTIGGFRAMEYKVSPALADLSFDVFRLAPHEVDDIIPSVRAAQAVLRGAMTNSDSDAVAAAAACAFINGAISVSPDHEQLVDDIAARAPAEYRDSFFVRAAIGRIATPLIALNGQPAAFQQLYVRAGCVPFLSTRR